jgi:hypothetical protein
MTFSCDYFKKLKRYLLCFVGMVFEQARTVNEIVLTETLWVDCKAFFHMIVSR